MTNRRFHTLVSFVVALGLSALTLSACTDSSRSPQPVPEQSSPGANSAPADQRLARFYQQELDWKACDESGFDCAFLKAPLDYEHPDGQTVDIALKRKTAGSKAIGSLVLNPGGPGGSGVDMVQGQTLSYFLPSSVQEAYNVVGFDPRGVGQSKPTIKCRNDRELDQDNSRFIDASTPQGMAESREFIKVLGKKCLDGSGDIVKFAGTPNVARDLDILRAALGDAKLNYLGFSYGTFLGATYAKLFPSNTGRMVLDGVLDPMANIMQIAQGQADGFWQSLLEFSSQCQKDHASECPLHGGPENGVTQIMTLLESVKNAPLPTNDPKRPLTASLALTGVIGPLYSYANWFQTLMPSLSKALNEGDGSMLLGSADFYNSRGEDGHYTDNSADAFVVINSLDYEQVGDLSSWEEQAEQLRKKYSILGSFFSYASANLDAWPVKPDPSAKGEVNPQLEKPILLVGTFGDPATPLSWAQNLAKTMDASRLLTYQGWGHTAYNVTAPKCVRDTVSNYLLTGQLPQDFKENRCELSKA